MLTRPSSRTSSPASSRASRIAAAVTPRRDRRNLRETPTAHNRARWRVARARSGHRGPDDRADCDFRIEVEHEPAGAADEPLGSPAFSGVRSSMPPHADRARVRYVGVSSSSARLIVRAYNSHMSILKIARMGHPVLRAKARALHPSEIRTSEDPAAHRRHVRDDEGVPGSGAGGAASARKPAALRCRLPAVVRDDDEDEKTTRTGKTCR